MAKDPRRKGQLRRTRPVIDDPELIQLASVLAEYQLDNNAYGWFRPPWRNGEWAVTLAKVTAFTVGIYDGQEPVLTRFEAIFDGPRNGETYERAGALYKTLIQPKINTNTARLLAAALRCLQLKIANSHGGGA